MPRIRRRKQFNSQKNSQGNGQKTDNQTQNQKPKVGRSNAQKNVQSSSSATPAQRRGRRNKSRNRNRNRNNKKPNITQENLQEKVETWEETIINWLFPNGDVYEERSSESEEEEEMKDSEAVEIEEPKTRDNTDSENEAVKTEEEEKTEEPKTEAEQQEPRRTPPRRRRPRDSTNSQHNSPPDNSNERQTSFYYTEMLIGYISSWLSSGGDDNDEKIDGIFDGIDEEIPEHPKKRAKDYVKFKKTLRDFLLTTMYSLITFSEFHEIYFVKCALFGLLVARWKVENKSERLHQKFSSSNSGFLLFFFAISVFLDCRHLEMLENRTKDEQSIGSVSLSALKVKLFLMYIMSLIGVYVGEHEKCLNEYSGGVVGGLTGLALAEIAIKYF